MTLDEIRHQLSTAHGIPQAALVAAVEQAEALVPEVIDLIDLACKSVMLTWSQEQLLFYGVHAVAAGRRTELYEPLLALIEWRPDDVEVLLGEAELHALLISTCGPEGEAPFDLLVKQNIPGTVKCSLFLLIARMVWEGRAPRAEFVALLDRFDRHPECGPESMAWFGWQSAIVLLGLTEFEDRMRAGWQAGRMPFDRPQDREEWLRELNQAAHEPGDQARFVWHHAEPITDVLVALRSTTFFGFDDGEAAERDDPAGDICMTEEEQNWLADFLLSEMVPAETMALEALDGFLTGLAAGPGEIAQEEWWPRIWSESDAQPEYETEAQEPYVRALIDRHLETIRRRLAAGRHEPLIEEDSEPEAVEEWAFGFAAATVVRPGSWDAIGRHKQAALAVASIALLIPPNPDEEGDEELEALDDESRRTIVGNLPHLIRMAYAYWRGQPVKPLVEPRRVQKVGRNDPCPCGSGRKYKRCCGAN